MSTASLVIDANQGGLAYTADLNAGLAAINTCHSGSSAPTTEVAAGKLWLDTSGLNPVLKIYRNGWKSLFELSTTSVSTSVSALTASSISISGTSTFTGAITANGGLSTTTISASSLTASGNISGDAASFTGNITSFGNLSIAGGTFSGNISAVDAAFSGNLTVAGNGTFTGDVQADDFNTTSDRRLKTDINNIENALDKVKALQGVSFKMNNQDKIGLIAQDTQEVIPEVVKENEEGYLSVSYGNIVGLLIEAIKEQQVKIESLEKKLGE